MSIPFPGDFCHFRVPAYPNSVTCRGRKGTLSRSSPGPLCTPQHFPQARAALQVPSRGSCGTRGDTRGVLRPNQALVCCLGGCLLLMLCPCLFRAKDTHTFASRWHLPRAGQRTCAESGLQEQPLLLWGYLLPSPATTGSKDSRRGVFACSLAATSLSWQFLSRVPRQVGQSLGSSPGCCKDLQEGHSTQLSHSPQFPNEVRLVLPSPQMPPNGLSVCAVFF